jgi:hypothetical protein
MMKRFARAWLLVPALAAIVAVSAQAAPVPMPENLRLPPQNVTMFTLDANGSQIYACKARGDEPSVFEWTLKAPDAELLNGAGEKVGRHYAGPTWEANDGSKVVGEAVERAPAPALGAIPWLLLRATSSEGAGVFSTVTYVQRIETVGGIAPTEGCDQASAGAELPVPYRATYAFAYGTAQ